MAHVLRMAACEVGDPVALVILPEASDSLKGRGTVHDTSIISVERSWVTLLR